MLGQDRSGADQAGGRIAPASPRLVFESYLEEYQEQPGTVAVVVDLAYFCENKNKTP